MATRAPWIGGFELTPDISWRAEETLRLDRTGFVDARVEADFLRFQTQARRLPLILVCVLLAGFYLFQSFTPRFAAAGAGQLLSLAAAIVLLICAALLVVFVVAPTQTSTAEQVAMAHRYERIMLVVVALPGCLQMYADAMFQGAQCAGEGVRCRPDVPLLLVAHLVLVSYSHVRVFYMPFVSALLIASYVAGVLVAVGFAYQTLVTAAVATAIAVALGIESAGTEGEERKHFSTVVLTHNSNEYLIAAGGALKALIGAVVPPELVARAVAMDTVDRIAFDYTSDDATVSIAAIHDFALWSTGLLPFDVVRMMHTIVVTFTQQATHIGVSTAMTYGDCYVACAGLLAPMTRHGEVMTDFARWQLEVGMLLDAPLPGNFKLKVSVCSGELKGGVAGSVSLRFIVAGAAFDEARELLETCPAHGMVRGESFVDDIGLGWVSVINNLDVIAPSEFRRVQAAAPAAASSDAIPEADSANAARARMSSCTLRFVDPEVEAEMAAFAASDEHTAGWHSSIVLPITFLAILLGIVAERIVEQELRTQDVAPLALLLVAVAVVALRSVNQFAGWRVAVPVVPEYLVVTLSLLAVATALVLVRDTTVTASPFFFPTVIGCPNVYRRMPWLPSVLLQWLPVAAPLFFFASGAFGDSVAYRVVAYVSLLMVPLLVRYGVNRGTRLRFAAEHTAVLFAALQHKRQLVQREFVAALVPPHAVPMLAGEGGLLDDATASYRHWGDLSTLQLRLNSGGCSFDELVRVGAIVGSAVAEVSGGRLELVQCMGDSFLVAGPFDQLPQGRDELLKATAHGAVDTVRDVARQLGASAQHFTAVLTAGSAFSALLGASLSTFRLFGPCVRESNAILSGAPTAPGACAVYASEWFRRLHGSSPVVKTGRRRSSNTAASELGNSLHNILTAMSLTVHPCLLALPSPAPVAIGSAAGGDDFCAPLLWRVRGSGVCMISVVKL
jgi:hypothetical protein